ncbi:MoaF C-terminal domain-containing protein [Streptomyces sp. NPDC057474]|uniref:MoaF C-terminal domain-containing protein n=1 Tax=Streptomyces sp. NPDC057474 TaxID=3346144 RepID=UPI0036C4D62C
MSLQTWQSPEDLPLLADGISQQTQYRPPFSADLAGRELELVNAAGARVGYRFVDDHAMTRSAGEAVTTRHYDATLVREGIYLIDALVEDVAPDGAVAGLPSAETWALDLNTGRVTIARSWVHERGDGVRWVSTAHERCWLPGSEEAGEHLPSAGMAGHRVLWRYSDTDSYDHVYLNAHNFAWQCVTGVEEGLTEHDRTRTFEVADRLYLFEWSEHVQPVESVLFVDLREMKTYGRMFGWEERVQQILHHQFGARGQLLNVTTYPDE